MKKINQRGRPSTVGARHGGHDPDKVLVGGFVKPEMKALLQITATAYDEDTVACMMRGISHLATAKGILVNGKPSRKAQDEILSLSRTIRDNKRRKQAAARIHTTDKERKFSK